MPDSAYLAATIAVAATVTLALRALPFVAVRRLRSSGMIAYLGARLPAGVMVILVVYLLRDVTLSSGPGIASAVLPVVITAVTYVWRRQMLLSICAGTLAYGLLGVWLNG